jgi:nitroreductase
LIEALIDDAAQAPWTPHSAPKPWAFTVVRGAARISELGARALQYARQNRPQLEGYRWTERPDFSVFYNAPAVIIISGRADNPLALEECTRAGQVLTIAAVARGLASCWVGSPMLWLGDPDVRGELLILPDFRPHAVFTLGYAAVSPPRPAALEISTTWLGTDED